LGINLLIPILVAIIVYRIMEKSTERKKRLTDSRIGVLIFESYQEEVATGIGIMERALECAENPSCPQPYIMGIPRSSWGGVDSLPIGALLIIRECKFNKSPSELHPHNCRRDLKNYFVNICATTERVLYDSYSQLEGGEDWRKGVTNFFRREDDNNHLVCSRKVLEMINDCIRVLKVEARW
ncbi:hypothetical protein KKC97_06070, partial [bacterium]|nr:hypothetical protein [bacterium]